MKIKLLALLMCVSVIAKSQNTPWSTTSYMGIGTTTPATSLHINGTAATDILTVGDYNNASIPYKVTHTQKDLRFYYNNGGVWYCGLRQNNYFLEAFNGYSNDVAGSGFTAETMRGRYLQSPQTYVVGEFVNNSLNIGGVPGYDYGGTSLVVNENAVSPDYWSAMQINASKPFDPNHVGTNASSLHIASKRLIVGHATGISFGAPIDANRTFAASGIYSQMTNSGTNLFFTTTNNYNAEATSRLVIDFSGNIGMGTNTPNANAKLDVNGNIYSNGKVYIGTPDANTVNQIAPYSLAVNGTAIFNKAKVKLYGTWPDYVFGNEYKLPALEEIEKFIKKNHHLSEIPSSKDVEMEGIDLGETQALLLKKIEELTLIIIEQNKRISALEKK